MKRVTFTIIAVFIFLAGKSQYSGDVIVEPILTTDTTTIGQGFIYPDLHKDQITISKITIQPGKSTGWHKHDFPVFAFVLKGNLTVELENHKFLEFPENSSSSCLGIGMLA